MCNSINCSHDRLDDDLSDLFGDDLSSGSIDTTLSDVSVNNTRRFETKCASCRGSGVFRSYTGRVVGDCFKCKGKGVIYTKADPAVLAENRRKAAERRERKAAELADQGREWLAANPVEAEWLNRPLTGDFTFHNDMLHALLKYGSFTEKQEAAVRNATAKFNAARERKAAEQAERAANAAQIDITKIKTALDTAHANGLQWPKIRLADFTFSRAGDNSRNAGAVYVKAAEGGFDATYFGKVADGRFFPSRDCDAATEQAILEAAADPEAAAIAYGHQTGVCSCCGRKLTNKVSVELGIGPICRKRFGW